MNKGLLALSTSVLLLGLAGCSGNNAAVGTTDSPNSSNEAGKASENSVDSNKSNETIEIKWFRQEVGAARNKEFFKKIEDKFHELNPDIKVTGIANNSNLTATEFLKTSLTSGDMPDVMTVMSADEFVGANALLEIPDDVSNLLADPQFGRINGKLYTMPYKTDVVGVFYNKDMFQEQGIAIPTKWSELVAAVEKLKTSSIIPMSISGKDSWVLGMSGLWPLLGAEALESNPDYPKLRAQDQATFADSIFVNAMNKFDELNKMGAFGKGVLGINYQQATEQFTSGKAGMYLMGSWIAGADLPSLKPGFKVGFFPLPSESGVKGYLSKGSEGWSVSATTKHPEAALKFVKFLFEDKEVYASLLETESAFSTTAEPVDYPINEYGQAVLDGIKGLTPYPLPGFGLGETAWVSGIDSYLFKALQNVISGGDIGKEVAGADAEWKRLKN